MKIPKKGVLNWIFTCVLLIGFSACCKGQVVNILTPPQNITVNRGSNVNISCGYQSATALRTVWFINGNGLTQEKLQESPFYHLNSAITPARTSLTVFSINGTTTFQCVVQSNPRTTSTIGTVTVIDVVSEVTIATPPENATVCRGSDVTISCGYVMVRPILVTWIINGTSFSQLQIFFSPLYQQYRQGTPTENSLIVFSINYTTTFQCVVQSTPNTTSTLGTITVNDKPIIEIAATGGYRHVYVSWRVSGNVNDDACQISGILVALSLMNTSMTVNSKPVGSHNFTGLPDDTAYNITVAGLNMMSKSISFNFTSARTMAVDNTGDINDDINGSDSDNDGNNGNNDENDGDNEANIDNRNNDGSGSSVAAIAGGVIGGIVVVIIIIIILIGLYFFYREKKESVYDDTTGLKSPPGTGGTRASEGDSNDKVLYAAHAQIATIPHQTSASGEQYAVSSKTINKTTVPHHTSDYEDQYVVSTKTANKSSEEQPPSDQYDAKKGTQEITYADLQELPTDSQRNDTNHESAITYSQIA